MSLEICWQAKRYAFFELRHDLAEVAQRFLSEPEIRIVFGGKGNVFVARESDLARLAMLRGEQYCVLEAAPEVIANLLTTAGTAENIPAVFLGEPTRQGVHLQDTMAFLGIKLGD